MSRIFFGKEKKALVKCFLAQNKRFGLCFSTMTIWIDKWWIGVFFSSTNVKTILHEIFDRNHIVSVFFLWVTQRTSDTLLSKWHLFYFSVSLVFDFTNITFYVFLHAICSVIQIGWNNFTNSFSIELNWIGINIFDYNFDRNFASVLLRVSSALICI